jgi:Helix-turn-helix/NACHT domain
MKGSDILKIRENLGLTQHQLAEKLGVAMKTVSRWENGETKKIPDSIQQKLLQFAERGRMLIYTNEAKLFLQLQRIRRGSISPWLLLPHITTSSIAACDAFVNRGVTILYSTTLSKCDTFKLTELPNLAERGPIVLLGSAGSGKTFLMRWIADSQGIDAERDVEHRLGNKIPVIFPLIEYNEPPSKETILRFGHPLLAAIAEYHNCSGTRLDERLFLNACKRGEVLFLFDALDEISNEASRRDVIRELETLMLAYDNCAFILTSRHEKYGNPTNSFLTQIKNQTICELNPLTFDEQQELIKNLYLSVAPDTTTDNKEKADYYQLEENFARCIQFIKAFPYKDSRGGDFLRNPLHLVLVALLVLEGCPPSTTDVQLEHQCLELNIIRWPEARSIGQSIHTSVNFPGTGISKNQIWSKLSKWALEIVENNSPLDTAEIERWVLSMPLEPEGETVNAYAKRITTLMLERLPFILHLEAKGKFSINEPHLTHLAAHRLTEMRNRVSLASWLFNNDNYKDWKRIEVWKRAILITSIIHRQPEIVNYDLEEFVEKYSPDELDSMFDTADSLGLIIKDLLERAGVLDWEARKNFYRFLMEVFLKTDYDETAKFFFRIFQSIQTPFKDKVLENEEEKQNRKLLKEVCNELIKYHTEYNTETSYDIIWRECALRYAIGEFSGEETERKLLNVLKKLEKQSFSIERNNEKWKELEISKRRTIFVFLLMQLPFSHKMPKYRLSDITISTLINIIGNKDKYEVGVVGRACDVLDKVKLDENLNLELQIKMREIFQKIDSSVTSLKVVASCENASVVSLSPELLISKVEEELKHQEFQVYTSETVKRLKNFFYEVQNYYSLANQGQDIDLAKILLRCAIDRNRFPLLRAVSFLYLSELPPKIEEQIPNLLGELEACFKSKPRPEEDKASVGAVQIYDYNQACLNRHYSRRSQKNNSGNMLNLKAIQDISYTS